MGKKNPFLFILVSTEIQTDREANICNLIQTDDVKSEDRMKSFKFQIKMPEIFPRMMCIVIRQRRR